MKRFALFPDRHFRGMTSLWVGLLVLAVCVVWMAFSFRTHADVVDERDFSLAKQEQMRKAKRLLAADSVDQALVLLTMVVGDVEAKKKITRSEAETIADAFLQLGEIQSGNAYSLHYNDYGKAYTWYKKASEIAEAYNLKPQLAKALLGLGVKYEVQLSSYDDPLLSDTLLSVFKRSLSLAIESESWETVDQAMKNLASSAFSRGRGKEISEQLTTYISLPRHYGKSDNEREFVTAFCHTMQSLADDNVDAALRHTRTMEKYAENDPVKKIDTYSMRAEIFYQADRKNEALICLDTVSQVAKEVGNLWYDMQIEHSKSSLYEAMGKKAEADSCRFRYYDLRERLFEDRSANRIKDLHFMNRIDRVTLEMQKITLERQHARMLLYISLVVLLVVGGILLILMRTNRRLRESHRRIFEEYSRKLQEDAMLSAPLDPSVAAKRLPSNEKSEPTATSGGDGEEKYKSSNLTDQQKDEIFLCLKRVLSNSEAALSSRYQIRDLATESGVSARAISQVINERSGGNFASFLAEHRINTVCRRIKESASFRKLTIEAMAASVGIQSRSYFSTTFKKVVGLNPSEFIRQADRNSDSED